MFIVCQECLRENRVSLRKRESLWRSLTSLLLIQMDTAAASVNGSSAK